MLIQNNVSFTPVVSCMPFHWHLKFTGYFLEIVMSIFLGQNSIINPYFGHMHININIPSKQANFVVTFLLPHL